MGQQQLLLIVLGVIIVGIAIVVGINLFQSSAIDANRNAIIQDLNTITAKAKEYYKKPASLGGGANSFLGFTMPTGLASNANGTFTLTATAANVVIVGVGTETGSDGSGKVKATATVTAASSQPSITINN